jgi:DNA-binding NarL/FixJ family response regulator
VRVLLADDDPNVRSAVRLLLEDESAISLVAECTTADHLREYVEGSGSDVVLIDWDLPGLSPCGELQRLRTEGPDCQIVAMSGRPEHRDAALRAGAVSFVCKGDAPESLLKVLRALER